MIVVGNLNFQRKALVPYPLRDCTTFFTGNTRVITTLVSSLLSLIIFQGRVIAQFAPFPVELKLGFQPIVRADAHRSGDTVAFLEKGAIIAQDDHTILYKGGVRGKDTMAHTLLTGHFQPFHVILPDHTELDINFESRLTYSPFPQKLIRDLVVVGEANIKVHPTKGIPCLVHLENASVLLERGAISNIRSYHTESSALVIPLQRSAVIQQHGQSKTVVVGQMARVSSSQITIEKLVYPEPKDMVVWNNSIRPELCFNAEPLSDVLELLALWYGLKVRKIDAAIRGIVVTGFFPLNGNLTHHLDSINKIESNQAFVQVEGRELVLYPHSPQPTRRN